MKKHLAWLEKLGLLKPKESSSVVLPRPELLITDACVRAVETCVLGEKAKGHEGVAYLFGRTDGRTTLAVAAMRPNVLTTRGSFDVSAASMATVVRTAARLSLQVVGQVHTHPGCAYHSDGDLTGMRIRYPGYVSIVVPDYGQHLPSLDGASILINSDVDQFADLDVDRVKILHGLIVSGN